MSYNNPRDPFQCSYRKNEKFIQIKEWKNPRRFEIFKYYECLLEDKYECNERTVYVAGKRYCKVRNNER